LPGKSLSLLTDWVAEADTPGCIRHEVERQQALVNTYFNTRGEPVVCSPRDALECFWTSPLDALVIGSFCLEKNRS
jgi:hypothetical protein